MVRLGLEKGGRRVLGRLGAGPRMATRRAGETFCPGEDRGRELAVARMEEHFQLDVGVRGGCASMQFFSSAEQLKSRTL